MKQAAIFLLVFANIVCALLPPAFPGQGSELTLNFYTQDAESRITAGSIAFLELAQGGDVLNSSIMIEENGSAKLYSPFSSGFNISVRVDDPSTPADVDFISSPTSISGSDSAASILLIPAGVVSGFVAAEGGEVVNASVSAHCPSHPGFNTSVYVSQGGPFKLFLPAGECTLHASSDRLSGSSSVLIRKGEKTTANIFVAPTSEAKEPQASASPLFTFATIAAALILAAFIYLFHFKGESDGEGKGVGAAAIIAVLLMSAGCAGAATVTKTGVNSTHLFDLKDELGYIPNVRQAAISGHISQEGGCNGSVIVELSDDGKHFAQVGSADMLSGSAFSLRIESPGAHRFYKVSSSSCTLSQTILNLTEFPDLMISALHVSAADQSGEIKTGAPVVITVVISNRGGPFDRASTSAIVLRLYETSADSQHLIGEVQLEPSTPVWFGGGSVERNISWIPSVVGPRTIYAYIDDYPGGQIESSEENNWASTGIFVNPGAYENRRTAVSAATLPSFVELKGAARERVELRARYTDSLTQQPILGANCTVHAPDFSEADIQMSSDGVDYIAVLDSSNLGVGVYNFSVRCSKEGYAASSYSGYIPFTTSGGQVVDLVRSGGAAHGLMVVPAQSFGAPHGLRVVVERFSQDSIGVRADTVKINGHQAVAFFTDAPEDGRLHWLRDGAKSAEWIFDLTAAHSNTLSITFDPILGGGASAARISVRLVPISGACFRKKPEIALAPATQTGEAATPLYFHISVANRDSEECDPSTFTLSAASLRAGWRCEFSPSQIVVHPGGANSSIATIIPPEGESPGEYAFKIEVRSSAGSDAAQAQAVYIVSSPRKRSFLDVRTEGVSPILFTARYTDSEGRMIGTCRFYSSLVGGRSVEMFAGNGSFSLAIPTASIPSGNYSYMVSCEAQGFNTKTFTGNVTVSSGIMEGKPVIEIAPAVQSPPEGKPVSFSIHVIPSGCTHQAIRLEAHPPPGFSASLDRDTASGCGETIATLRLTPNGERTPIPLWGSITASSPGMEVATARFIINPSGVRARTASCISGDAQESPSNLASAGDPCWNWNDVQTYAVDARASDVVYVTGKTFFVNCSEPVVVRIGNGSVSEVIASAPPNGSSFNYTFTGHAFTNLTVSSKCLIESSGVTLAGPQEGELPDLFISSASFSARLTEGAEESASVTVRNSGATTYSSYSVSVGAIDAYGAKTTLATKTIYSHAAGADKEVELRFIPPSEKTYTLFFKADSADEIPEENETNNELIAGLVEVASPAGRIHLSRALSKGWNIIPFINGANYTHACPLASAVAFDPSTRSFRALNASTLSFQSQSDAGTFSELHGTSSHPKTAAAFGGAWVFSLAQCQISIDAPAPGSGWRSLSKGFNLVSVLPQDAGNTVRNLIGNCSVSSIAEWDSESQEWHQLQESTPLTEQDAGRILLLEAREACMLR